MCGIAGIYHAGGNDRISPETVSRMVSIQRHRGPDETGVYVDDRVGLGHARLSIIDLAGGRQPLCNEDESLWITYNGEIFNYVELGEELRGRGHRFRTSSDTEVILHLYEDLGAECLSRLNGQFAFAIWDSAKGTLFLGRDRMGIRPLHYSFDGSRLVFASEIKGIFTVDRIPRRIDPVVLDQIFTFWAPLPGYTPFQGIRELPPGHYLLAEDGGIRIGRYWDLADSLRGAERSRVSLAESVEEVGALLQDATRIRLRSDVPVGAYLSGGLDSSGIAASVKKHFNPDLKTFGIRFENSDFDEGPYQQEMVSFLGTRHTEILAENRRVGDLFPKVLWHVEKPLLRTAPVPLFLLSEEVRRQGYKVVLTGEGADEIFGGYNIFRETLVRRFWARRPGSSMRPLLIGALYPYIFQDSKSKRGMHLFFGKGLDDTGDPFFSHRIRWENTARIKTFFSKDLRAAIGSYDGIEELRGNLPERFGEWHPLSKAQYVESVVFLGNYLLSSQGDRVAMGNSVEIRLPFLDYRVVERMALVHPKHKIWGMQEKYLLKKIFRDLLPERIVRRPKHPYRAPIRECLLGGGGRTIPGSLAEESLHAAGLFDPKKVGILLRKLTNGQGASEVDGMALAGIVSGQAIHEMFVERFPAGDVRPIRPGLLIDRRTARA